MKNLVVMYHFVSDSGDPRSFTTQRFREQVEFLCRYAEPVTIDEFVSRAPSAPTFSVTFDDGLKDGYTNCLETLESLGVKASYFVSTAVWDDRRVLQTQQRQLLLRLLGPERLAAEFNARVEPLVRVHADDIPKSAYDDSLSTSLKYVMDHMDWDASQRIAGELFAEHFDERTEFDALYLTPDDARDLAARGHQVGVHGYAHRHLGALYLADQRDDIARSIATYERVMGTAPRSISYPFGSFNLFTLRLARAAGVRVGVTTVKRYNDSTSKPLELGRFDCIELFPATPGLPAGGFGVA